MTVEEAAPILAPAVDNGVCPDDPRVLTWVNEAVDEINSMGVWVGSMIEHLICTLDTGKTFTLPRQIDSVIEVTQLTPARDIGQGWYEILNPSTYVEADYVMDEVLIDRGEVPLFQDLVGPAKLRVYSDLPEDAGKSVWFEGMDGDTVVTFSDGGTYIAGERLAVATSLGGYTTGTKSFTKVNRVRKSVTRGPLRIFAVPDDSSTPYQVGYMAPDETEARYRRYYFPSMTFPVSGPAQLRVTGLRRHLPLTSRTDRIPFDVRAVKLMILALQKELENMPEEAAKYRSQCGERLQAQVKRYMLDPRQAAQRKAQFLEDELTCGPRTFGFMRAKLALELPNASRLGRIQLGRVLNAAERRLIESGKWRGSKQTVTVEDAEPGLIVLPADCESILVATIDGIPILVRDEYFEFNENGPGYQPADGSGPEMLIDRDEDEDGARQYLLSTCRQSPTLELRCKARHVTKSAADTPMQIVNFEALKEEALSLMFEGFLPPLPADLERSAAHHAKALRLLDDENREYLSGVPTRMRIQHDYSAGSIPPLR